MKTSDLVKKVYDLALPKALEENVSIWDVEFEKEGSIYVLTIYLDSETEVSITNCENVSRYVDPLLDAKEFDSLPSYSLCVSSAGMERKLTKPFHFEQSIGKLVNVGFYKAIDGSKNIDGTLVSYNNGDVTIDVNGENKTFLKSDIATTRLTFVM